MIRKTMIPKMIKMAWPVFLPGFGVPGAPSPEIVPRIAETASLTAPSGSPALTFGINISLIIRPAVMSGMTLSKP
jgi:hypothetical protein